MTERPTIRPVTLARLVEVTDACEDNHRTTPEIETEIDVSRRRARETILEGLRIGLLQEKEGLDDEKEYRITHVGTKFLESVRAEDWHQVSSILSTRSPHYGGFLEAVATLESAEPGEILSQLENDHQFTPYDFNQTTIEVVGDWGERLGAIQRNAFTGSYYLVKQTTAPSNFPFVLLSVFEKLEESTAVNLTQRYLSIPKLREFTCEELSCTRAAFDSALTTLTSQNVGKLELSGAPIDTGAKDAKLGIKQIELSTDGKLVSTNHSTEQIMTGVEQFGKQYYYLAVHDDNLTYTQESDQ